MKDHVAQFKTFAESLQTPELARRINGVEESNLQREAEIAEKKRAVSAERKNITIMKAVIADRDKRGDHLPLWNPFDGRGRPLA